jgi:hypothetical protein
MSEWKLKGKRERNKKREEIFIIIVAGLLIGIVVTQLMK